MASSHTLSDEQIAAVLQSPQDADEEESDIDETVGDVADIFPVQEDANEIDENNNSSTNESDGSDNEANVVVRHRKTLTCNRIVNSLEKSLHIDSYELFPLPSGVETLHAVMEKGKKNQPEKKIEWVNKPPTVAGRQGAENIVRNKGGPINQGKDAVTPIAAMNLFLNGEYVEQIVSSTNRKIDKLNENAANGAHPPIANQDTTSQFPETNAQEIRAFIGLLYARGLLGMNHQDCRLLFQDAIGHPIFAATMSLTRFSFLHAHITFDNILDREERFKQDRFAAIRELFENFNGTCGKVLQPDEYMALDETLYGSRNQVAFKQYNAHKPNKYGILFKSLNGVKHPFTFRAVVYAGKPIEGEGPYYIQGIIPTVKALVSGLQQTLDLTGRNITMDNLYTSHELFEYLLQQNMTGVGTLRINKRCIPSELKPTANREPNSYKVFWEKYQGKLTLHSYVVNTKSKGKKNILVLSSMPPLLGTTKDDGKSKPAIIKFYDFSKGGTDIVDQRMGSYSVNTKSKRWPLAVFAYMLDTMRINSQTLFCLNNDSDPRKLSSFKFCWDVVIELVTPLILARKENLHLTAKTRAKIRLMLNDPVSDAAPLQSFPMKAEKKKRCGTCIKETYGDNYTAKRAKVCEVINQCTNCADPMCRNHVGAHLCYKCSHN